MEISPERARYLRNTAIFLAAIAFAGVILYFSGFLVAEDTVTIAGCSTKWNTIPRLVKSELCPDPGKECIAQPYISQHNAFVDAATCACAGKNDPSVAKELEESYSRFIQAHRTASEICEGRDLVKWSYG